VWLAIEFAGKIQPHSGSGARPIPHSLAQNQSFSFTRPPIRRTSMSIIFLGHDHVRRFFPSCSSLAAKSSAIICAHLRHLWTTNSRPKIVAEILPALC
jgi:hypothetical protein